MSVLAFDCTDIDGAAVVRPTGLLDLTTYRTFRDRLLKCAVGEPTAVITRLDDGFACATPAFMSVFSTVWMRVSEWPGVPIMLVGESPRQRDVLARGGAGRMVPRFTALDAALDAVRRPPTAGATRSNCRRSCSAPCWPGSSSVRLASAGPPRTSWRRPSS